MVDTLKGSATVAFLHKHKDGCRLQKMEVDKSTKGREPAVASLDYTGKAKSVNAFLNVETDVGRGRGIVRLCQDPTDSVWKAYTLFTSLEELKGFEEPLNHRRGHGVEHGEHPRRMNWIERRERERNYADGSSPTVLIVGRLDDRNHRNCD